MAPKGYELGIGIDPDHVALAESVQAFTARNVTREVVRAAVDNAAAQQDPPFWDALVAQGLLGLAVPEERGGQGAGLVALAVALESLGRSLAPGPLVPTVLAATLLAGSDCKAAVDILPSLVDGSTAAAVALGQPLAATPDGPGFRVTGTADAVLGADRAERILLPIRTDARTAWVVVERSGARVTEQDGIDVLRGSGRIDVEDLLIGPDRIVEGLTTQRVQSVAAVVLGAEDIGVMSWCVSTAAEYARTRVQFGRPIGQFQGVKHRCAKMGIALEQARAVLWDAASALDRGDDSADFAASITALVVPDAAVTCAQDCIQVLGGIGFTWEHDAHLYYRRALALRGVAGTHATRADEVATQALAGARRDTDLELPAEAETIRAEVRAELEPIAAIADEDELLAVLGDGGWVQPHLPSPYGRGASPLEQIVIAQEIKALSIPLPSLLMGTWAVQAVVAHGTERQKTELAAPTLRGDLVWCQLFSEPGAGSDLASLTTKAERVEGGWKVNGQKIWTSVAQFADWGMLIARTSPEKPKHEGISYFVLDMASQGVTVRPLREMTGSALFNEVFFDDVFVPDDCLVGAVDDGWNVARTTLAGERVALGQKIEAYATDKDLLRFARSRELGPVARVRMGELIADSHALDVIGARVVLKQLSGSDVSATSSVGKLLAMALGQAISEFVVAELGPAGVVSIAGEPSDLAMEQLISGRATTIYGGTTEVQLNVIGERMLGLPRDAEPPSDR
ncbi:acyl-CoA dehydrogenase [Tsukamurella sp. 8F]|uniref:acyl-CoA dehydrogenase n=1 Tax=unclassified Tsukamurella TaxID=2633480 RepID=UPI0023B89687|nr:MULTISPECIES: acyl-CoA dehydrogenase [unclassified Tsukamurella]MDF0532325.1 acyl-CoA dehydrogenase [Tsukamurella sp. 8J]MDF0589415.1 acyl-CoA dehydrogenase [Tsukamurella sp. 8F]